MCIILKILNQAHFFCFFNAIKSNVMMCSREHSKLCFEHLETFRDAQNNLLLQRAEIYSEVENLIEKGFNIGLVFENLKQNFEA